MASRVPHAIAGTAFGSGAALFLARGQEQDRAFLEVVGGGLGGYLGGLCPDVLEPASNSSHRSVAHSWAVLGLDAAAITKWAGRWQEHCRAEALRHDSLSARTTDQWARFWHSLVAALWRLLSGFTVGFLAGYGSHLVLDAVTPRSLPLLG